MEKIEFYLQQYLPQITKKGNSGIYEVRSPSGEFITNLGRAGVQLYKDRLLMEGLKLNIKIEVTPKEEVE